MMTINKGNASNFINELTNKMINFYSADPSRIQHFIKVHHFAKLIGETEGMEETDLFQLEVAAVVHDIGIKPAEEKYGKCSGNLQEIEGPPIARNMLEELGADESLIERVCYLVAHHHTYVNVDGMDYRILLEADFLVNLFEEGVSKEAVLKALETIFRTNTGIKICKTMFGIV